MGNLTLNALRVVLALVLAVAGVGSSRAVDPPDTAPTVVLSTPRGDWRIEVRELAGGDAALPISRMNHQPMHVEG